MGSVYLATDRLTGGNVAIKVMDGEDERLAERFSEESRLISELDHPAIVRYVASGKTLEGEPYFAMEWLEGEDLHQRLARQALTIGETLEMARRVSEGLAWAHGRHVVHRDIKPSNVFLVGGDPAQAKILDFGIARTDLPEAPVASSGVVLGTIGFMSPEQASGSADVDSRTDVFSLGCVLFQCLTGAAPFTGEHAVAVLAKVLCEEAPLVSTLRPEVSPTLDDLVARMLAKDPAARPSDGAALLAELERALEEGRVAGDVDQPSARVGEDERRIVSVVLFEPAHPTPTRSTTYVQPLHGRARAVEGEDPENVRAVVERHGGELRPLANGAYLVLFSGRGDVTEQAERVAGCALALGRSAPGAQLSLATGRSDTSVGSPLGRVIDCAVHLLRASGEPSTQGVLVDEVTFLLLETRFAFTPLGRSRFLLTDAVRPAFGEGRRLLSKTTPFVGRDEELALLEATLTECIDTGVARAVLVTGAPGIGKSRLRAEFVQRALGRGATVMVAQADPVAAGSALVLCRRLLRHAAGLDQTDERSPAARLREFVATRFASTEAGRIGDFLGELLGLPSATEPSAQLRAARNDPRLMAEWLRRSFIDWLVAECRTRPVLLVLEDLHWGDLPSVTYIGEFLYEHRDAPLLVLALARPSVHEVFPRFWPSGIRQELELGGLTRTAAERFARAVFGDSRSEADIERVVRLSDGNAFYLEELIRCVMERPGEALPETILALVEGRLGQLEGESRRLLRAASVFGEAFWESGLTSLLGRGMHPSDVRGRLHALAREEILEVSPSSRFGAEPEYVFRHGLLREAAYAMLTPADRVTAHRLAGIWLETSGEDDALVMADHFERSDDQDRAVPWLVRAAHRSYEGNNLSAVVALSERGVRLGAAGSNLGLLRAIEAYAVMWSGAWPSVYERSLEALRALPFGSTDWFRAAATVVLSSSCLANPAGAMEVLGAIAGFTGMLEPSGPYAFSVFMLVLGCYEFGQAEMARTLILRLEGERERHANRDLAFDGWFELAVAYHQLRSDEPGLALAGVKRAALAFETIRDTTSQAFTRHAETVVRMELEQSELAAAGARAMMENTQGLSVMQAWGGMFSAWASVQLGRYREGIETARGLLESPDHLLAENSRCAVAEAELELGLDSAERTANLILNGPFIPDTHANALSVLSRLELRRENFARAEELAARGIAVQANGIAPRATSILLAVRAEALLRSGRQPEGKALLRTARDRILRTAGTLSDTFERYAYVHTFAAHERTLALAAEWLD
jgi:hypothetical protein